MEILSVLGISRDQWLAAIRLLELRVGREILERTFPKTITAVDDARQIVETAAILAATERMPGFSVVLNKIKREAAPTLRQPVGHWFHLLCSACLGVERDDIMLEQNVHGTDPDITFKEYDSVVFECLGTETPFAPKRGVRSDGTQHEWRSSVTEAYDRVLKSFEFEMAVWGVSVEDDEHMPFVQSLDEGQQRLPCAEAAEAEAKRRLASLIKKSTQHGTILTVVPIFDCRYTPLGPSGLARVFYASCCAENIPGIATVQVIARATPWRHDYLFRFYQNPATTHAIPEGVISALSREYRLPYRFS